MVDPKTPPNEIYQAFYVPPYVADRAVAERFKSDVFTTLKRSLKRSKDYMIADSLTAVYYNACHCRPGDLVINPRILEAGGLGNGPPLATIHTIIPAVIRLTDYVMGGYFVFALLLDKHGVFVSMRYIPLDHIWHLTPVYYRPFPGNPPTNSEA